jgi:FkbM family methyltransferase
MDASSDRVAYHETPTGNFYLPCDQPNDCIVEAIVGGRIFEENIVQRAAQFIGPGAVVLDVGACFGQMSILFGRMVRPFGKVYAFEADEFVFELLERNVAANQMDGVVQPVFGAVWHQPGVDLRYPEPDFRRFPHYGSYGIAPGAQHGRVVRAITIDSIVAPDAPVTFMKVDCQGSDLFAMQGARATIARHRMPIIFEFEEQFQEEFGTRIEDYKAFIAEIDYRVVESLNGINFLIVPSERIAAR